MSQGSYHVSEDDDALAGQYVLGTLTAGERDEFESRLESSIELQKSVNQWQVHFVTLTDRLAPLPAPQSLSVRIERSLDTLDQVPKKTKRKRSRSVWSFLSFWQNLALWRGVSAACFILAMVFAVQLQISEPTMSAPTYIAVLVAPENKTPGWVIQTNQSTNQMQLVPLAAVQIPEGKALQFWTKAEGWNAPVSLGLVKKGETLNVALDKLPPLTDNQLFEFTLEQESGSPTGKPTGPIQSIGRGSIML